MEKTAIELLIEQIKSKADSLPYNTKENRIAKGIYVDCLMMAKQARGMEEQQIIDAYITSMRNERDLLTIMSAEDYYNETYNQDK